MASRKKHARTRDRICAVQVLYTSELQSASAESLLDAGLCLVATELPPRTEEERASEFGRIREESLSNYALHLVHGVEEHKGEIDKRLEKASDNWALSRMPIVDLSILRLAVFEMYHCADVPVSVSINEAVELAKGFGGEDDSPRFVNGVLGRIARSMDDEPAGDAEAEADGDAEATSEPAGDAWSAAEAEAVAPAPEPESAASATEAAAPAPHVILSERAESKNLPHVPIVAPGRPVPAVVGASGAAAQVQRGA